jgi:hypothetical protein
MLIPGRRLAVSESRRLRFELEQSHHLVVAGLKNGASVEEDAGTIFVGACSARVDQRRLARADALVSAGLLRPTVPSRAPHAYTVAVAVLRAASRLGAVKPTGQPVIRIKIG